MSLSVSSFDHANLGTPRVLIHYNGSGHAGDQPRPLSALFDRLQTDALDPWWGECMELAHSCIETRDEHTRQLVYIDTGPIYDDAPDAVRFCGNFETYSHGFCIDTDDAEVIEVLLAAIRANAARRNRP
ncbi:MAG TPA: hypothetical protein VJA26_02785 [Gammaproteobacteria bacterium]|nr:hypothetical protein [Gammaproteobacteria bacterium]